MVDNYLKNPEFINIVDLINKRNFLDANLKLDSLISRDKDSYFLNNIKGVILLNLGDLNTAEIFLKKSINLNINFIEAYSNLGTVFFLKKNAGKYFPLWGKNRRGTITGAYFCPLWGYSLVHPQRGCKSIKNRSFTTKATIIIFFKKNKL